MQTLPNCESFTSYGGFTCQHLHKAWHSPGLSNPIPGRSDQQTSPSLSCHTTGLLKNTDTFCVWCAYSMCARMQTSGVRCSMTEVTQANRHKQAVSTLAHQSLYCQAQSSIHNHRASCNSQCDHVFPQKTNNWSSTTTVGCAGSQRQLHMLSCQSKQTACSEDIQLLGTNSSWK